MHVDYLRHQQQVDLLTLKVVSKSRVTWATSVPIFVVLVLSVLELHPMYTTDVKQKHRLMPPPYGGDHMACDQDCWYIDPVG